jgi:hypothetical protein
VKNVKNVHIHHTRDIAAKQWSESRKILIEGFFRILFEINYCFKRKINISFDRN